MARQAPVRDVAPTVQRLRLRYAKRGRLRFTSHRDFSRAFERALVRARVPVAYSSGFHPHPRISYAGASPTGAASEAEYLEIGLATVTDPAVVRQALDEALPDGLDVLDVVESGGGSLRERLEASGWRFRRFRCSG
jgi:radical SAM-linked protein